MKYENSQASSTNTAGRWIHVIGIIVVGLSVLIFLVSFANNTMLSIAAIRIIGISGFISGMMLIGFGSGLKCLAGILESNYRLYQNSKDEVDHITSEE